MLSGKHTSYWIDSTGRTNFPTLENDIEVDIAIVGGGIVGITTAFLLAKAGKKVAIFEARKLVEGVTGFTTAKVTALHDIIYDHLISKFGEEQAKLYYESQQNAIDFIDSISSSNQIDCDFTRTRAYTYTEDEKNVEKIQKEVDALKKLGITAGFTTETELPFKVQGAVYLENQAQFHPRKYLLGLLALIKDDCEIYEQTRVTEWEDGEPCTLKANGHEVKAKAIVLTTHYPPTSDPAYVSVLYPKRSYVLSMYAEEIINEMHITIDQPVFSVRSQTTDKGQMLIITGEEHTVGEQGNAKEWYNKLLKQAAGKFTFKNIEYLWSTQDNYTPDRVPYVGKYKGKKHTYMATGFGGWGMTNGTMSAGLISDLIQNKNNQLEELYSPSRMKKFTGGPGEIIKENIKVAGHLVKDRLGNDKNYDDLNIGEGKIIKQNGKQIAVYKTEEGNIKSVSAVCTHMGCILQFNNAETSWDCPCHGSRFNIDGKVLHGPATVDLEKAKLE